MPDRDAKRQTLDRRLAEARAVLAFERLWPVAVAVTALAAAFLALSWFGFWVAVPRGVRIIGVLLFTAGLVGIAVLAIRGRLPGRREALARLDRDSGDRHRPITSSQDVLADRNADPATRALWDLHRRRLDGALARVRVAAPSPRLVDRDRYALRAAALLLVAAAAFVAGPDRGGRVAAAFDWRGVGAPGAGFRLDSWIDPPAYTGRPPVLLTGAAAETASDSLAKGRIVAAPVNSAVIVRWSGEGQVEVATEGAVKPAAAAANAAREPSARASPPGALPGSGPPPAGQPTAGAEQRYGLAGDGRIVVTRDGTRIAAYDIHAVPDLPPTIALDGQPVRNARGSLTWRYTIGDDYGVVGAEVAFSDPLVGGTPVKGRTLVEPPKLALSLPAAPRGLGQGETTADLGQSPWAGATVTMVLLARDEGGNIGRSPPTSVVLPARSFTQPLARALVEQRRDLVLDPDHRDRIDTALDALTLAPDLFDIPPAIFLGLRTAKTRLDGAKDDPDLVAVADLLWSMALQIEDGDLSQTERDLRALQQALKDALARNAPPDEIRKLTQALRQQLDKFLSELAQKAEPSEKGDARADPKTRTITPQQLQSMLDRMEQAARNGDMAEAQRMLDQLRGVLENLKTAKRRSDRQNQAARRMNQAMGDLDKMMRDQQALRDETFQGGRQERKTDRNQDQAGDEADAQPGDGQPGDPSQNEGAPGDQQQGDQQGGQSGAGQGRSGDLKGRQNALRQKLQQMQKQMRDMGLDGEKGFDAAGQAMKEAEDALGQGQGGSDRAVEAQGRALRDLQQGAQGLAKQMAQGQGEGDGQGQQDSEEGEGQDDGTGGRTGMRTDPLGRPRPAHDQGLGQGFDPKGLRGGAGLAARAQQVLEELRRRLGDPSRPQLEQDYLERLLKRY